MIETITFEAFEAGPTLVITGGVHGNEIAPPAAIREAVSAFSSGIMTLRKGRVIFAPVCNPRAFAENKRCIDRNLNRSLYPKDIKQAYEDHIDPILCALLDRADFLVDLHSFTDPGTPYVLLNSDTAQDIAFAADLGLSDLIYGWAQAYAASGFALDPLENQGTTEYARLNGKTISVTVECGQHLEPSSVDVARMIIQNALQSLGMISGAPQRAETLALYEIKQAVFKARAGDFVKPWRNMEAVNANDPIARYDDGEILHAPFDGVILLSKPWAKPGGEWYNLAVKKDIDLARNG